MIFRGGKKDFKSRIVLLILSVVLVSGVINGIAALWSFNLVGKASLQNRLQIESKIISENVASSVLFDDAQSATEILSSFAADPAVLMATVQTKEAKVFASFKSENFTERDISVITMIEDIYFEDDLIGSLSIVFSKNEIKDKNLDNTFYILFILFFVFILVALLTQPIIKSLFVPLSNLHNVSEKIAETRDYGLRAVVESDDEVGQLSQMFNYMVEQIEHRDDMLEKQVRQRTTELEKLAEEFRFRAFHDNLTGLPNRALLNERFELSVKHSKRNGSRFACLLLDLDDFKTINDTKGHEFGDDLLREVAARLKSTVRGEDLVCRLGGDEFVVLVNDLRELDDVELVAQKILVALNNGFFLQNETIRTAVSIGGAVFPEHGGNLSEIKRHADVAMYRAKDEGKNRFCLFSEGMQEDVKYRLMIQRDLRPALEEKQFEIYLQPKVDPRENRVVGCEALVRWHHPNEGFLTPNKFIPFAEEIGMVAEIDYFVVRGCCDLIVEWSQKFSYAIPIAFNLSGRHFQDYKIVEVISEAIQKREIDPSLLEVEITEAVLIQDPEKAKRVVHALRDLGIGISLDDFGTGYSSLNYLRTLPIDTVKLDQSFVSNVDTNEQDRKLTRGIVSLTKDLNLKLIAEGVENESQLNTLLELGCVTMQGYYFLPPRPNHEFLQWCESKV